MISSKWFSKGMVVLVIAAMMPLMALASPTAGIPDRVDADLWQTLSEGQTSDVIVEFVAQADLAAAYGMDWDARGQYVLDSLREVAEKSQSGAKAYLDRQGLEYQTFVAGNELYLFEADAESVAGLATVPEVALMRAPVTFYLDPVVEDGPAPEAITDWGITDTKADQFWTDFGFQGEDIVVANIDTGVQWDHPALVNQYACASPTDPACWRDPSNICGAGGACDNNGHGTHTMGTMVSDDDPGLTYIAGMAPKAQWIACKGCESSSCSSYALNTCADWILAPDDDPANRPHVVNNSWGGGGCDNWYVGKVAAWQAAGVFPAFSAGNSSGCSSMGSPGDYQESFATTGHYSSRNHIYAQGPSCYGHDPYTKPNITAPAVSICSTVPTNGWSCGYSGTSMASPHSAGAVALLWSCNPSLIGQVDQTFQALQNAADPSTPGACGSPPDGEGNYTHGYGYLNVHQAGLDWCGGGPDDTMHVADIRMRYRIVSDRYLVIGWIPVRDDLNNPVDGADVEIEWTLPNGITPPLRTRVTNPAGIAPFGIRTPLQGVYQICVTDVAKSGWVYDPSQNLETCESIIVP